MKIRSKKIGKIVSLAASEERRSGVATGQSSRKLAEQMARLSELNAYRSSYAERSREIGGVSSAHWKDYQSFMHRLDQAVQSQQQIVRDSEQNLEGHRRRWLEKRRRLESLQRVLDSYRTAEYLHEERQQQRALDDLPSPESLYGDETDAD